MRWMDTMGNLERCTLCDAWEDPRWGLITAEGRWPLCDGCAPEPTNRDEITCCAERCRMSGRKPWTPPAKPEDVIAKLEAELEILSVSARRIEAEPRAERVHMRPMPDDSTCAVHDWPIHGLAQRLIERMRETHGKGGVTVCRDCLERALGDAKGVGGP